MSDRHGFMRHKGIFLLVVSCGGHTAHVAPVSGPLLTTPAPLASVAPIASAAPVMSTQPDASAPACDPGDATCDCEGKQRRRTAEIETDRLACADGLRRALEALASQRFDAAIAAVSATVDGCTGHTQGPLLAERGRAKLLLGHYADALKDLDGARDLVDDTNLTARVLLDRGDAKKALAQTRDADESFYWSNRISPSQTSRDRMTDKAFCPLDVTRGDVEAETFDGWLAWWKERTSGVDDAATYIPFGSGNTEPTTEANAQTILCRGCAGAGPWVVPLGGPNIALYVLARSRGKLVDFGVVGGAALGITRMSAPYGYSDRVELSRA